MAVTGTGAGIDICDDPDSGEQVVSDANICCPRTGLADELSFISTFLGGLGLSVPGLGGITTFAFELVGAFLSYQQLRLQIDAWENDIDNIHDLAECYIDIGDQFKAKRLSLRARDQEIYDYQNSRPRYPGPCLDRVEQARLNNFQEIARDQGRAMMALPSWACGDKCRVAYESAKIEVTTAMHNMAQAENYEQNQVDAYESLVSDGIIRSVRGPAVNLGTAFSTTSGIARDSLARNTASLNSAIGAFGFTLTSVVNRFRSTDFTVNNTLNDNAQILNQDVLTDRSPGPVNFGDIRDIELPPLSSDRQLFTGFSSRDGDFFGDTRSRSGNF